MLMRFFLFFSLLFTLQFGVFAQPVQAQFADSVGGGFCECFCHSEDGAESVSTVSVGYETCRAACDAQGERPLGCYTEETAENRPENNQLCWTRAECEGDEVPVEVDASGNILQTAPSIWGGQESFCPKDQGYCYNPPNAVDGFGGDATVTLGVPIGDLTEAGDIASYVEAVYTYLVSAAGILAVFLLMVGGVQWLMAGGNPSAIDKAKSRMTNALIGLTLLLSAYVIARIIDPRLVDFNFFAAPKVQTIIFLDASSSCEALKEQGLGVVAQPPESTAGGGFMDLLPREECGYKGEIISVAGAGAAASVGVEVGDTCNYVTCSDPYAACLRDRDSATGYSCVRCKDIFDNDITGAGGNLIEPNANNCANALSPQAVDDAQAFSNTGGTKTGSFAACAYHNAAVGDAFSNDSCVEIVSTPNEQFFNCEVLRDDAERHGSSPSCRMYDNAYAVSGDEIISLTSGTSTTAELDWLQMSDNSFSIFVNVCEKDPCGVAPPGGTCQGYVSDNNVLGDFCTYPVLSQSPPCQFAADLLFSAHCYDSFYIADWNEIVELFYDGSVWQAAENYADLYPLDENGTKIDDPYW